MTKRKYHKTAILEENILTLLGMMKGNVVMAKVIRKMAEEHGYQPNIIKIMEKKKLLTKVYPAFYYVGDISKEKAAACSGLIDFQKEFNNVPISRDVPPELLDLTVPTGAHPQEAEPPQEEPEVVDTLSIAEEILDYYMETAIDGRCTADDRESTMDAIIYLLDMVDEKQLKKAVDTYRTFMISMRDQYAPTIRGVFSLDAIDFFDPDDKIYEDFMYDGEDYAAPQGSLKSSYTEPKQETVEDPIRANIRDSGICRALPYIIGINAYLGYCDPWSHDLGNKDIEKFGAKTGVLSPVENCEYVVNKGKLMKLNTRLGMLYYHIADSFGGNGFSLKDLKKYTSSGRNLIYRLKKRGHIEEIGASNGMDVYRLIPRYLGCFTGMPVPEGYLKKEA